MTPTGTVADIADEELLRRVMANLARKRSNSARLSVPLWSAVADHFALGSTYAHELCVRFGYTPDLKVKP